MFCFIKRIGKVKTCQGSRLAVLNTSEYFSLFSVPSEDGADPASSVLWVVDVGDDLLADDNGSGFPLPGDTFG
jgi:hypothetical protein